MPAQWEYAQVVHPWNGKVLVAFTNPERRAAERDGNDLLPLLHDLGQHGFEMVTQQFFPVDAPATAVTAFIGVPVPPGFRLIPEIRQMIYLKRPIEH